MDMVAPRAATGRGSRLGAPFRLVGRRPWASAGAVVLLLLAGCWALWATQLWGLPDIGEPFDVAAFRAVRVPGDRNAFSEYRKAADLLDEGRKAAGQHGNYPDHQLYQAEWSRADPTWRDFVAQARPALEVWRRGAEKPDYLYPHPEGMGMKTQLPVTQAIGLLSHLALLEGSRLEEAGEMPAAWGWYRAALRTSRHDGRHGFQVERLLGAYLHKLTSEALTRWASDPRVDAATLRAALAEVIAIDAMTAPRSETIKVTYLSLVDALADPGLIDDVLVSNTFGDPPDWAQNLPVPKAARKPFQAARVGLADDRERSLRLVRLMTANWLAQADRPPSRRARLSREEPPIYEADPGASPPLGPGKLSAWLDSSLFASRFCRGAWKFAPELDAERPRQARLVVHLADQLYRREHGSPPPTPAALVGPDLKALPEGYDEKP